MLDVRNLTEELHDASPRTIDREKLCRVIIHRIDFSHDDGAGYWRGVFPVPRTELDGYKVGWRFSDTRKVEGRYRKQPRDWRDRPGSYTGGEIPYAALIKYDGGIDQMIPLSHYAPHARRWSSTGIPIAVAGDFRERDEPTPAQYKSLTALSALCISWLQRPINECLMGHDELADSSGDASKECPGRRLDMDDLRAAVDAHELSQLTKQQAEGYFMAIEVTV